MPDFDDSKVLDTGDYSKHINFSIDIFLFEVLKKLPTVFDGEVSAADALIKYRHLAEHLEVLALAGGVVEDKYADEIIKKIDEKNSSEYSIKVARAKLLQLVKAMKKRSPSSGPLNME